jgi:hypothetical protein
VRVGVSACLPGLGLSRVQGRSLYSPRHAAGAGATNTDPHHSGTDDVRKGGPLWLQIQGYGLYVMLRQDHQLVSTTGALVTTRTGFPPQVRVGMFRPDDGTTGAGGHTFGIRYEDSHHSPASVTAVPRPSPGSAVPSFGSAVRLASG